MRSSLTGENSNETFGLSPRYSSPVWEEVICSYNSRPILAK